jgi:hypothetical protein
MGEGINVYRVLVGKPKGKRTLGRLRHRWEIGIRMDCRELSFWILCCKVLLEKKCLASFTMTWETYHTQIWRSMLWQWKG